MDDCLTFRPTALSVVPALLSFLLGHDCLNNSLRVILVGAGDCPPSLLTAVTATGIRVSFGYGLTETSSGVAISTKGDPFAMEICPDDEITIADDGEILIKAPTCIMQGYYKMPEATTEAVIDGVLHSGDLGYIDPQGLLHITGRKKDILVLEDGTKIFLPEYEAKLSASLGTAELAVVLKNRKPVLVVSDDTLTEEEIRRKIRPVIDEYPRGQQITEIILRSAPIPRTATGKIQRYRINLQ
jgi:long-subunit acyl-CoA synthetase (AMP-forming)